MYFYQSLIPPIFGQKIIFDRSELSLSFRIFWRENDLQSALKLKRAKLSALLLLVNQISRASSFTASTGTPFLCLSLSFCIVAFLCCCELISLFGCRCIVVVASAGSEQVQSFRLCQIDVFCSALVCCMCKLDSRVLVRSWVVKNYGFFLFLCFWH